MSKLIYDVVVHTDPVSYVCHVTGKNC